jgi:hypothetical protein
LKQQELTIRVVDLRYPEDSPRRKRSKRYTRHEDYLRDIGQITRANAHVHERTETVVTLLPIDANPSLFDGGEARQRAAVSPSNHDPA